MAISGSSPSGGTGPEPPRARAWLLPLAALAVAVIAAVFRSAGHSLAEILSWSPGRILWSPLPGLALALMLRGGPAYAVLLLARPALSGLWIYRLARYPGDDLALGLAMAAPFAAAAWALRRRPGLRWRDPGPVEMEWLAAAALSASLASSLLSLGYMYVTGRGPAGSPLQAGVQLWLGDAIGVLALAPSLLARRPAATRALAAFRDRLEPWLQAASLPACLLLVAALSSTPEFHHYYFCFLPIGWIALRSGLRGAVPALLAMDLGVLVAQDFVPMQPDKLPDMQLFLLTLNLAGLSLGASVTGRRRAEASLRRNEERFKALIENSSDGVTLVDAAGTILYSGPSSARILGYRDGELVGRDGFALIHPEDLAAARDRFALLLSGPGASARLEARMRHRDGDWPWLELTGRNLLHVPSVAGLVLNYRDITERKRAEAGREQHLRYLEAMHAVNRALEGGLDLRYAMDAALARLLEALDCDRAWLAYPCDPAEPAYRIPFLASRPGWEPAFGKDRALPMEGAARAIVVEALSLDGPATWGADHPLPDAAAWAREHGIRAQMLTVVRPKLGKPWGLGVHRCGRDRAFTADERRLFRDIGARLTDALSNVLLHQDLKDSEARYRTLFEHSLEGMYSLSPDGRFLDANPALVRMLGCGDKAELVGRPVADFLPPGREAETARASGWALPGRLRRADGVALWVEAHSREVRAGDGSALRYEGFVRDVTERRKAEEALRESEERLRQAQKMEAIGRLAGGVAHDFNNLLTAINGYAELLLDQGARDGPFRQPLEEIRRAGGRAAALTGQLLAFSRKQVLEPKVLDLNVIVRDMDHMLRRLIGEQIALSTELEAGLRPIKADPGQLGQVILNLALNARDAMPGGGRMTLATRCVRLRGPSPPAGDYVLLAVSDTGTGMDAETLSHLFEPFFTTKGMGKGTGLGLSTVYGIIRQSGGDVEVSSAPGRGSEFRVYLPVAEEGAAGAVSRWEPREGEEGEGGDETILLVEDEPAVRTLVREVLEARGYRVLAAAGGEEALELAGRAGPIHLLLTDVVMAGMGGRELAERLRAARPGLSVLFMSGYTDDAMLRHGVSSADVDFFAKPFRPGALARKVRNILTSAPLSDERPSSPAA